jgi:hypothetical protein
VLEELIILFGICNNQAVYTVQTYIVTHRLLSQQGPRVEGWKVKELCSHDLLLFTFFYIYRIQRATFTFTEFNGQLLHLQNSTGNFYIYRIQRATFHLNILQDLQPNSLAFTPDRCNGVSSHAQQTPWCKRLGCQECRTYRVPKRKYQ